MDREFSWNNEKVTFRHIEHDHETSTQDAHRVVQELTATSDEWLAIILDALVFIQGKPNDEGTGFALSPARTDHEEIGRLIVQKLKSEYPRR